MENKQRPYVVYRDHVRISSSEFRTANVHILLHAEFSAMDCTLNIVSKCRFFFIFKHSLAPKRSWKIFCGGLGKVLDFLSVRVKPSRYITNNSALHPSGVGKSSTGLHGWGQGGARSLCRVAGSTVYHPIWQVTLRSSAMVFP